MDDERTAASATPTTTMKNADILVGSLLEDDYVDPKEEVARLRSEDPRFGTPELSKLDTFTRGYIEALFFTDEERLREDAGGEESDLQIAPSEVWQIVQDCEKFQKENWDDIGTDFHQAGVDFWFTRNHHGSGFWDGDWPEPQGERLTKAAQRYGQVDTYVGDDGYVYIS
jgi:hypothetical protein